MSNIPSEINLNDFLYDLPEDKIAKAPLTNRSDSKLLVYKTEAISHNSFKSLPDQLPSNAQLVFNDTKVIPARLFFTKETGALIEIFLLEPVAPIKEVASAMLVKKQCQWKCMIGNQKKWKDAQVLSKEVNEEISLNAQLIDRENQLVEFTWNSDMEFVHIIEAAGKIPLPPYINREVTFADKDRYQTVYSSYEGAVAAPTAGLHFDDEVITNLKNAGVRLDYLTLHVSAGTFQPIKVDNAIEHNMHSEQVVVKKETILSLLKSEMTIAVGTTSMRTLESLYWFGVKLLKTTEASFFIEKLYPYQVKDTPSKNEALEAILNFMERKSIQQITGSTEIFIFPGYQFRICKGLITNYHLPGSTLILLIAAFIGKDWRKIYKEALANDYRFLSYGDSSLLLP